MSCCHPKTKVKTMKTKALLPADYVLFDSWFTSPKTLIAVKALGYDVIAMIKRTERTR